MTAFWTEEESAHETVFHACIVDHSKSADEVACVCVVFDVSDGQLMMLSIEAWIFWSAFGSNWIVEMVGGAKVSVSIQSLKCA